MKLENLVNNALMVGAMIAASAGLESKAAMIHNKPGATVIYEETFTNQQPAYVDFVGWTLGTNRITANDHAGLLASYNTFTNGHENIEIQMQVRLGFTPDVTYKLEFALYQVTVGSYYSAINVSSSNHVNVVEAADDQPEWISENNRIPFNNGIWHNLSLVKNGLLIETYLDNQVVGRGRAKSDFPVDSFNISYTDWYFNPDGMPQIEVSGFKIWTIPSAVPPKLNIAPGVNLYWQTNNTQFQLMNSSVVDGTYSAVEVVPVLEGTNNAIAVSPTNSTQFFKLIQKH